MEDLGIENDAFDTDDEPLGGPDVFYVLSGFLTHEFLQAMTECLLPIQLVIHARTQEAESVCSWEAANSYDFNDDNIYAVRRSNITRGVLLSEIICVPEKSESFDCYSLSSCHLWSACTYLGYQT